MVCQLTTALSIVARRLLATFAAKPFLLRIISEVTSIRLTARENTINAIIAGGNGRSVATSSCTSSNVTRPPSRCIDATHATKHSSPFTLFADTKSGFAKRGSADTSQNASFANDRSILRWRCCGIDRITRNWSNASVIRAMTLYTRQKAIEKCIKVSNA